jgi:hypothetical protein
MVVRQQEAILLIFTLDIDSISRATGTRYTIYYIVLRNGVTDVSGTYLIRDEIAITDQIALSSATILGENYNRLFL